MTIRIAITSSLIGFIVIGMALVHICLAKSYSNAIQSAEEFVSDSPKAEQLDALSTVYVQLGTQASNLQRAVASDILSNLSSDLRLLGASQCSINTHSSFDRGPYRVTKINMQFMAGFDAVHEFLKQIGAPFYQPSRIESIHLVRAIDGSKNLDVAIVLSMYERKGNGGD